MDQDRRRFTHIQDPRKPLGELEHDIVHNARIEVLSAQIDERNVNYIFRITDNATTGTTKNLEVPVTFAFTVDSRQCRVIELHRLEASPASNHPTGVRSYVWTALSEDDNEIIYGIKVKDTQRLGKVIEFEVDIASGEVSYSHLDFDNPDEPDFDDPNESSEDGVAD